MIAQGNALGNGVRGTFSPERAYYEAGHSTPLQGCAWVVARSQGVALIFARMFSRAVLSPRSGAFEP